MPIQRGEIYRADLNPVRGREQAGRRPVVIVSNNRLNHLPLVVLAVPGTDAANFRVDYPENVRVGAQTANLPMATVFMAFQLRALDHSRLLGPPIGQLTAAEMQRIDAALAASLTLKLAAIP